LQEGHILELAVDRVPAIEAEVVIPLVVEAELHMVQSAEKHPFVQVEMAQTPPAVERSVRHIVPHSEGKTFDLPPMVRHSYGRYDTDYP
jgi:hypothetical protein